MMMKVLLSYDGEGEMSVVSVVSDTGRVNCSGGSGADTMSSLDITETA